MNAQHCNSRDFASLLGAAPRYTSATAARHAWGDAKQGKGSGTAPRGDNPGAALHTRLGLLGETPNPGLILRAQRSAKRQPGLAALGQRAFGRPKLSAEREAAVRASLAAGTRIGKAARPVGTGNATVARIAAEMQAGVAVREVRSLAPS